MSTHTNDGPAVYGSQKVTATPPTGGSGGTGPYVAKNIKVDAYDADIGVSKDELGNEAGQWFMSKIPGGTVTLQFPDASTKPPDQYSTISLVPAGGGTAVVFIIYKCGLTYDASGETMMDVGIRKKMGT